MRPDARTAGVPIRYAVTAVINVYYVGLAPDPGDPGGVVSVSALLPGDILSALNDDVREHFLGHLTLAVARFTRRMVERTELVFAGVATDTALSTEGSLAAGQVEERGGQ